MSVAGTDSAAAPRWDFPPQRDISALRAPGLPPVIARLLAGRGIDTDQKLKEFLDPSHRLPHDPMRLPGMDDAVPRLYRAVQSGETAGVFGDFDVDGITGTAIVCEGLTALGAKAEPYLPNRADEGHGLSNSAVDSLIDKGATLIVTVDTGITDSGPVAHANRLGVDVIITDHHVPSHGLPPAVACINPYLNPHLREGELPLFGYPFADLCGAGIAFKLMQGLYESHGQPWNPALLELAALGTVADLVPLLDENRYIVAEGIRQMADTRRPGLIALCETARLSPDALDTEAISYQIVPRLNSAGRLGDPRDSLDLLTTTSPEVAASLAYRLDALNRERRNVTSEALERAYEQVEAMPSLPALLVVAHDGIRPGIAGLVAGRLADRYRRPAVALSLSDEYAVASARSIPGFNIIDAIRSIEGLVSRYGGHSQAAGFTVGLQELDQATRRLETYAAERLASMDLTPTVEIDAVASLAELTESVQDWLATLEPFGKGNPRPVFASLGVRVLEVHPMGNTQQHLRLQVEQDGAEKTALAFGQGDSWRQGMERVDLVYTLMEDSRQPGRPLALRVSCLRVAQ